MTDRDDSRQNKDRDERAMADLLRLAGPREPVPPEVERRVYARVKQEWARHAQPDTETVYRNVRASWSEAAARPRRIRRWAIPVALAASAVFALLLILPGPVTDSPAVAVGTVTVAAETSGSGKVYAVGDTISAGATLSTSDAGGMSIRLANAESIRLDRNTTLVVYDETSFELRNGRVYADTGDLMYRDQGLVIDTAMGSVTDIGTQFAVSIGDTELDVAVREGRVDVAQDDEVFVAVAGERIRLDGSGASITPISARDDYWAWTADLAPAFEIDGEPLLDFLRWAARETGYELVFEDNELRMQAMRVDLHGSVSDFAPLDAVEAVLAGTTFKYRITDGKIIIER